MVREPSFSVPENLIPAGKPDTSERSDFLFPLDYCKLFLT
jgi:hypothetical protein